MISYMDYVQRCFYTSTNWSNENSYEDVLKTSKNLLAFPIPHGFRLSISNRNTEYSYSSLNISQFNRVTASLAYLYSSVDMKNVYLDSKQLPLQSVLQGYRLVQPPTQEPYKERPSLFYGKMYFPSQFLEGMVIKRLSQNTQIIAKFISTPKQKLANQSTIVTLYLQKQTEKSSQEYIFSTNDSLLGFRYLYNLGNYQNKSLVTDSSLLSLGCELWFSPLTMSPGLSTALRYSTHLTSSGKPLTITLAMNPLLGTVQSTYAIKTGLNSTFCSKYTFNLYSYESDLTLGVDLLKFSTLSNQQQHQVHNEKKLEDVPLINNRPTNRAQQKTTKHPHLPPHPANPQLRSTQIPSQALVPPSPPHGTPTKQKQDSFMTLGEEEHEQLVNSFMSVKPARWMMENNSRHFINSFNQANFESCFKATTSLSKQDLKISWEGKFKDWLLSSGVSMDCNNTVPRITGYGVEFQYSS